ncbi:hypothetical protein HHI36_018851, partial [Cryptolaemus montrouzieri]
SSAISNDRLSHLGHNAEIENPINMNDSFYLKTASALLPSIVSGDENSIRQLIDAIELYDTNETIQLKTITNETWEKYFKNLYTESEYEEEPPEKD